MTQSSTVVMKLYWLPHSANELTVHTWSHPCMCITPPLRHLHSPRHTSPTAAIHQTAWIPPHMHTYTHAPWLATSSSQVTDVNMWGDDSNEYWVTEVMSLPFCLVLPPTLTLKPFTRASKPTPSFSSRWQPLVHLASRSRQAGRISQLLARRENGSRLKTSDFSVNVGRTFDSCCHEIIKTDNNCESISQWSAIWQLHQFDW